MDKAKMTTPDGVTENIEKLAALFPAAVTEMRGEDGTLRKGIDFEKLRQLLSHNIVEGGERYEFSWVGKKAAMAEAARPTTETLCPIKADSRDWDTTENLYIEGDNLAALKILQESYLGKVKMIYIDPPYNTGNDFIYADDFMRTQDEENEQMGMFDEEQNRMFKNTDNRGRFHSDWCSMVYARLALARNLLMQDGVLFISIDDAEVENLRKLCDEILGEDCFVDCITWNKRVPKNDNKGIGNIHEYVLVYVKDSLSKRQFVMLKDGVNDVFDFIDTLRKKKTPIPDAEKELKQFYSKNGYDRGITLYCNLDNNYEPWGKINMSWPNADTFGPRYNVLHPKTYKPTKVPDRGWRWNESTFHSQVDYNHIIERYDGSYMCGGIWFAKDENTQPSSIKYLRDVSKMLLRSIVSLKSDGGIEVEKIFDGKSYFSYPKPVSLLYLLTNSIEEKDGIYLDFFSGSATTAHAVMQLNAEDGGHRKFIMVQLPEPCDEKSEAYKAGYKNICEIGKERIRRAGDKIKAEHPDADLDIGFRVFRVDSSNMRDVYYKPEEFTQTMLGEAVSNIKPDRTDLDLLYACLLDCGVPIHLPHTTTTVDGCTIHNVDNGALMACFDEHIPHSVIRAMAAEAPLQVIFRDSAFAADADKINVTEIFKNLSPDTKVRVI